MVLQHIRSWYATYERPISILFLVGGFVFNAITLRHVDAFTDNLWVVIHLIIVAVCIILINRKRTRENTEFQFWLSNILQFFFGGLLSTYIVFYFRGGVIAVAWPFIVFLLIAFTLNESLKRKYTRLEFQIGYLFLCIYLFLIFCIPLLVHQIGQLVFVVSGISSLLVLGIFLYFLRKIERSVFEQSRKILFPLIVTLFLVVNGLYFLDIIPPLPLSLEDADISHGVTRTGSGDYVLLDETITPKDMFLRYFNWYPTMHIKIGDPVYAFSAIFSPIKFSTKIVHEWQWYDSARSMWVTKESILLSVAGGREEGYRTYSMDSDLTSGKWRVNVKTPNGQIVGRMTFYVEIGDITPALHEAVK